MTDKTPVVKATLDNDLHTTAGLIPAGTVFEGDHAVRLLREKLATAVVEKRAVEKSDPDKKVETR